MLQHYAKNVQSVIDDHPAHAKLVRLLAGWVIAQLDAEARSLGRVRYLGDSESDIRVFHVGPLAASYSVHPDSDSGVSFTWIEPPQDRPWGAFMLESGRGDVLRLCAGDPPNAELCQRLATWTIDRLVNAPERLGKQMPAANGISLVRWVVGPLAVIYKLDPAVRLATIDGFTPNPEGLTVLQVRS